VRGPRNWRGSWHCQHIHTSSIPATGTSTVVCPPARPDNPGLERNRDIIRPKHFEAEPAKTPHLHVRPVKGLLFGDAIAITGNATALLQLRVQVDRTLRNETAYPFEEGIYHDANGSRFEVAVKRARIKKEMSEPTPKPEKTAEDLPWTKRAGGGAEG
jgi:hypothetical protein